ncbi:MAG: AAA family ATPase, partial [Parvibaculaceae bacterium]
MNLLERDPDLRILAAALAETIGGEGRLALIGGEAGIGKTSFIDHFVAGHGRPHRILTGQCDSLFTPSPLGPLYDIARTTGGRLLAQLEGDAPRAALFSTMLDLLRDPEPPTVLVIEDIHWADEATLDLIKYLGRRIAQTRALLVLSYRDDEAEGHPPLRILLGDLATSRSTVRIGLRRLSVEAVRRMSEGKMLDPEALHRQTSGNPFFLAEVLSHAGSGIPQTVSDSVMARVAKLTPAARNALETVAVLGSRVDPAALEKIVACEADHVAECRRAGLVITTDKAIAFRHELVRDAILASLDPRHLRDLHRLALNGLRAAGSRADLAQMAGLAEGAGDPEAMLDYGPAAARAAAAVGAHRAAAAHYRRTLAFASDRPPAERAALPEAHAEQCAIIDELAEAIAAHGEAIALWRADGDRLKEGLNLSNLAWPLVRSGQNAAAVYARRR